MTTTPAAGITIEDYIDQIAATHRISIHEAIDEVWDAIEILWAPEDRPAAYLLAYQQQAIGRYIAEQYATNRTRL